MKTGSDKAQRRRWKDLPTEEGVSLIRKEDFPVDMEASINLFHSLCRIGKTANPHMAEQVGKDRTKHSRTSKMDLKKLLTGGGKEQAIEHVAADLGLDKQVLSFLIQNSIRPSIEAGMEQLRSELDPETWRKTHCPVCGSLPSLNLLKGEGGSVIPFAPIAVMNGESIGCPVLSAATRSRDLYSIFMVREKRPAASISAINVITISRRSITEILKHPIPAWKISRPSISMSWPSKRGIRDLSPTPGVPEK